MAGLRSNRAAHEGERSVAVANEECVKILMAGKKIVTIAGLRGGAPTIEGTGLNCAGVVMNVQDLSVDYGPKKFLERYSYVSRQDLLNCLSYCASQQCVQEEVENYCAGCMHDPESTPEALSRSAIIEGEHEYVLLNDERVEFWKNARRVLDAMEIGGDI